MRLARSLPVIFSLLISLSAAGQDSTLVRDNLENRRLIDSTHCAELYNRASRLLESSNPDSARILAEKCLERSNSNGFSFIEALDCSLLGKISERFEDWENTLYWYLRSGIIFGRLKESSLEAGVMDIIANKYSEQGIHEKAAYYYEKVWSLTESEKDTRKALAAEKTGAAWLMAPDDSLAYTWYLKATAAYKEIEDNEGYTRCREKLASLLLSAGNYNESLKVYNELAAGYKTNGESGKLASAYNSIGFSLFRQKNYQEALDYFRKAAETYTDSDNKDSFLTDVYSNIGICFQNLGKEKEMLSSFSEALRYAGSSQRLEDVARLSHILAVTNFMKGDNYHAEIYCEDCIEAAKKSGSPVILQQCYKTLSEVSEKGNDFVKALKYYEKYLSTRDSVNLESRLAAQEETDRLESFNAAEQRIRLGIADEEVKGFALRSLRAENEKKENEVKLLLKQQELNNSEKELLANSLALEKEKNIVRENEARVKELERDRIIKQLEIDRRTQQEATLKSENRLLESEKAKQELNARKEKQIRQLAVWLVVLMVCIAIMILAGLISTRRKNYRLAESKKEIEKINLDLANKNSEILAKNEEILQQKEIIEVKNQSITDSIQYASRIQSAVLPPVDFISEMGLDNFVLFKPKDIVSGDFYWGMRKGSSIYVAAADCTGHGVPGAFMSMLGHTFLDEILNTSSPRSAASILDQLREGIISTLKQKGTVGETRDGMDISICIIDMERRIIDFAGANNPVYLVRKGSMIKLAADRMPIGLHVSDPTPFTRNEKDYLENDIIYLFTDGYADQFGGPKNKKFMYKPFQDLLVKISGNEMAQQKELLEKTFNNWKGSNDQVDDVLVIGIKL
ncbi:MAG: tetratricopeptide repeat protein [Bacteroidales bacterium]